MLAECPNCKSPIDDPDLRLCGNCGALLGAGDSPKETENLHGEGNTQVIDHKPDGPESGASLRIVLSSGDVFDREISLPETRIGKGPKNDIVIADPAVSANHALLGWDSEGYTITDLGSRNGTFVGGVRITDKYRLSHGDVISVGR